MKLTKYLILIVLSGCSHYPKDLLNNQITKETYLNENEHEIFQKASAEDLSYLLTNNNFLNQHSCYFNYQSLKQLTLMGDLLKYESQIAQLLDQEKCLFFENHFNLMRAQAYFDKKNYKKSKEISEKLWLENEGELARQSYMLLIESLQNEFKQKEQGLQSDMVQAINSDEISHQDFFNPEFPFYKIKQKNKEYKDSLYSLKNDDIDSVIVFYDRVFPSDFVKGFLRAYEAQNKIQSIKFINVDKELNFFNEQFKESKNTGLILYELQNQSIINLIQTMKGRGKIFIIDNKMPLLQKNTYFINNTYEDDLKAVESTLQNFTDVVVMYDHNHSNLLKKSQFKNFKSVLLSVENYEKELESFLKIPYRAQLFKGMISNEIKYLQKTKSLPPNVVLLLDPDLARLVYPFILYWGQNKTVYFGLDDILSKEPQLDKSLEGLRIYKRPYQFNNLANSSEMLGVDAFNIINNFNLFKINSEYIWSGNWGFYHLEGQYFFRELNSKV